MSELSLEEKKAIDHMESLLLYSKEHEYFSPFQEQEIDDMNIVLNIVKKQSKEIEELKMREVYYKAALEIAANMVEKDYINKEKVKERIKQLEKEKEGNSDGAIIQAIILDYENMLEEQND